jgi:nucleoside-diphosphate-sugar epimerase
MKNDLILVAGGGGFIGGHLVASLLHKGHRRIRAVDIKPVEEWYQVFDGVENIVADLKEKDNCLHACREAADV